MKKDFDFKFRVSVSREGYEDKETAKMCLSLSTAREIGRTKMAFKEQELTVSDFLNYAVSGHAFCNLFKFDENRQYWIKKGKYKTLTYPIYRRGENKGYFKLSFKSDEYFYGSQTIFVDIDYTHFSTIEEYINKLTYIPTCVYTSFSDMKYKGGIVSRRFRLVYVFDEVLDADKFRDVTFYLYDSIVRDTEEPMYDSCGCSYSQYMNGSNSNEVYASNVIYNPSDFVFNNELIEYTIEEEKPVEKKKIAFTEELVNDMTYAPYEFVVRKWFAKGLRYFTRTEMDFNDNYYTTTTEDYCSLYYYSNKVSDGEQRRKKLYMRCALRRVMKEDVTPDELLYNLFIDRYKFFDNSDDILTIDVLQTKVKAAMATDIEEIKSFVESNEKPNFVINPEVVNKHEAVAKARREITNSKIGEVYDTSLSVSENLDVMKNLGYTISSTRLYQFCKEYNINTKVNRKERTVITSTVSGYNPNLSIRENMRVMGCTKYQVEKAKKNYESCLSIAL